MQSARTFVLFLCAVFVIARWGSASAQTPIDIVTENYPPYEMQEAVNGLRGFDYEVAMEAFTRMGYVPTIRFLPWKRALKETESGTTAGVLTCAQNVERDRYMLFSDPISSFTDGLFKRKGHAGPQIRQIRDVIGQKVASMAGYESLKELQDIGADPIEVPNTLDGLNMLQARRFDYLHGGREMTEFMIRKHGFAGAFEFISLDRQPFHFCFSKAYPGVEALMAAFNAALAEMRRDGTYAAIHGKYR
ncbi:substrate-binding periplasmic protein [Roseibium sediminicola]|uniref:Transporter substrate-binding domain-containing protein n=1 Tax=Roseibium sediminicola TaxID=2933272 RepID=A0ABT0GQB1_9HYPH|nr:transporter substrate-binding domain-containing protein [Roseibium sp. CAU 1639]MCK7611612.1 transporter substrate-binding domain-containing protein [Roseibium sp. CAU 1639]